MSTRPEKIDCGASYAILFFANFAGRSFSTPTRFHSLTPARESMNEIEMFHHLATPP